jgi:hypothetical protein
MQPDGNLVLYDGHGHPVWASNTWKAPGAAGSHLSIQDDGNVVIYTAGGKPIWATSTVQPGPPGEVVSLVAKTWTKKWNSNPLAGGCKSEYLVGFEVPNGTRLFALGLTTNRTCGDHPFNTKAGDQVGSVTGGGRLIVRPPNEVGPAGIRHACIGGSISGSTRKQAFASGFTERRRSPSRRTRHGRTTCPDPRRTRFHSASGGHMPRSVPPAMVWSYRTCPLTTSTGTAKSTRAS